MKEAVPGIFQSGAKLREIIGGEGCNNPIFRERMLICQKPADEGQGNTIREKHSTRKYRMQLKFHEKYYQFADKLSAQWGYGSPCTPFWLYP